MSKIRQLDEEEEPEYDYDNENENEEEEEAGELVVIDDELLDSLQGGIQEGNPIQLTQAVDVIIGFLGYKSNFMTEEDIKQSPLSALLPTLISKLNDLYKEAKEGSAKKEKVKHLLETLSAGILDSFDKFKKELDLFEIYCKSIYSMKDFVDEKVLKNAFLNASKLGLSKENYRNIIYPLFSELLNDETLGPLVLQMQYSELIKLNEQEEIESLLPTIVSFYLEHKEEVLPYVKSLVKRLAAELRATMEQPELIISWKTLATLQLISNYMIETKEKRLLYPVLLILSSFLQHFPVKIYLPFQIRIASILHRLSECFEVFEPILCWATEALQVICSSNFKGGSKFNWDVQLKSPRPLTFEFCNGAIDQLKRIFFANMLSNCESIAFPEYIMPIQKHLETIVALNNQLSNKVKPLLKMISDQSKQLISMKKELQWTTRKEQINQWKELIDQKSTPLKVYLTKQSQIKEAMRQMKEDKPKKKIDDGSGITAEIATVDDV